MDIFRGALILPATSRTCWSPRETGFFPSRWDSAGRGRVRGPAFQQAPRGIPTQRPGPPLLSGPRAVAGGASLGPAGGRGQAQAGACALSCLTAFPSRVPASERGADGQTRLCCEQSFCVVPRPRPDAPSADLTPVGLAAAAASPDTPGAVEGVTWHLCSPGAHGRLTFSL